MKYFFLLLMLYITPACVWAQAGAHVSCNDTINARLDTCNVFLKGLYVEAGISPTGIFGSSVKAPPCYHPNDYNAMAYNPCGTPNFVNTLAFVADVDKDGWDTGAPKYIGDYILPGTPYEGWCIQADGHFASGYDDSGSRFYGSVTGNNIGVYADTDSLAGVWSGSFSGMTITQTTSLKKNDLYLRIKVVLANTTGATMHDIYYMRMIDPDNSVHYNGRYQTINHIERTLPNIHNVTVISATADSLSKAYLALGTTDTNAKCLICSSWPITYPVDIGRVFSETFPGSDLYAEGCKVDLDLPLVLAFRFDSIAAGATKSLSFFYAFSQDAVRTITGYDVTGMSDLSSHGITVFPNPTGSSVQITGLKPGSELLLYDIVGRLQMRIQTDSSIQTLSLENLPPGVYELMVKAENGAYIMRERLQKL